MSYILDALRKSESERKQGRIPDLGTSMQMVHKTRASGLHWSVWVVLALVVNAGVFAYLFWPRPVAPVKAAVTTSAPKSTPAASASSTGPAQKPVTEPANVAASPQVAQSAPAASTQAAVAASSPPGKSANPSPATAVPTLIVPSSSGQPPSATAESASSPSLDQPNSIPLLGDESPAFQKQVPPLHFSGHIYSSVPSARRVVINDMYLGEGDWLGDLQVQRITESGVVFDLHGQLFRVGVVSDWTGPN